MALRLQPRRTASSRSTSRLRPRRSPGTATLSASTVELRADGVRLVRAQDAVRLQRRPRPDRGGQDTGGRHADLRRPRHRRHARAPRGPRHALRRRDHRGAGNGAARDLLRPRRKPLDARAGARDRLREVERYTRARAGPGTRPFRPCPCLRGKDTAKRAAPIRTCPASDAGQLPRRDMSLPLRQGRGAKGQARDAAETVLSRPGELVRSVVVRVVASPSPPLVVEVEVDVVVVRLDLERSRRRGSRPRSASRKTRAPPRSTTTSPSSGRRRPTGSNRRPTPLLVSTAPTKRRPPLPRAAPSIYVDARSRSLDSFEASLPASMPERDPPSVRAYTRPMRILIAEDETIIRLDLRGLLEGAGLRGRRRGARRRGGGRRSRASSSPTWP